MDKKRILLVEDEAVTAMDLQSNLIRLGYDVPAYVASGEEAIRAAADLSPDLILMDITLAGPMSGVEAAEAIRAAHAVPVVFLTAHADGETLGRAKRTEPFGYLPKPCGLETLVTTIEVALYKGEADAQRRRAEEQLKSVLEQQKVILGNIGVGVLYLRSRKIIWVNRFLSEMFGYSPEEIVGRDTELFYADRASYKKIGDEGYTSLARGEIYAGEIAMRRKDGFPIWCRMIGQAIEADEKKHGSIWLLEDVTEQRRLEQDKEHLIAELQAALVKVKQLSGLIPICSACKKIRTDDGFWQQIEIYIHDHSEAEFTHGMCPDCGKKWYGDHWRDRK